MFQAVYRSSSGALTVFTASGLHTHVVTGGIINSITRLHPVGNFYWVILRSTDPWILKLYIHHVLPDTRLGHSAEILHCIIYTGDETVHLAEKW